MIVSLALLLAAPAAALLQPDPYGAPPPAGTVERLAYDAERGGAAQDAAIDRWLTDHADAPPSVRSMLYHRLCVDYGVHGGGEARVSACTAAVKTAASEEDESDLKTAIMFRGVPPLVAQGGGVVVLIDNPLGSKSASITVNGISLPWFVDTGAEISTLTASTAAKLNVRMLGDSGNIGTPTGTPVVGRLGVIDRLTIGGATIEHLPVLVLPDAMLTITKHYTIPAILGLPALAALGRVAWLDGGRRLALGRDAPTPSGKTVRVYWHEDGLGIPVTTPIGTRGAQFDSGADKTALFRSALPLLSPAQTTAMAERTVAMGGAGGTVATKVRVLPRFTYTLAGTPLTASDVNVEDKQEGAGRIGSDMIVQTSLLTIDFTTMTLAAKPLARP